MLGTRLSTWDGGHFNGGYFHGGGWQIEGLLGEGPRRGLRKGGARGRLHRMTLWWEM